MKINKELEIDLGFCKRLVAESSFNKEEITFALAMTLIEKLKN
ncbi:hypothetical protein [Flavobacterium sp. IMCC34518]|nr:hypothetical protein [Flavobacterium sp. IMCC34518]